jgi:hypothetical protein
MIFEKGDIIGFIGGVYVNSIRSHEDDGMMASLTKTAKVVTSI